MEAEDEDKKYLQECQSKSDSLQKQISQKEKQLWVFYSWKKILVLTQFLPTPLSFAHMVEYLYFHLFNDASWIVFSLKIKKLENMLMIKTYVFTTFIVYRAFLTDLLSFCSGRVLFFLLLFNISLMAITFLDSKYNRPL